MVGIWGHLLPADLQALMVPQSRQMVQLSYAKQLGKRTAPRTSLHHPTSAHCGLSVLISSYFILFHLISRMEKR